MFRKALLASALVLTLTMTACTGKSTAPIDAPQAPEPAPAASPAPTTPATPTAPAGQTDKSPVSSEISVPNEPWITAPAAVSALTREVRIKFSGPVDKASVESHLKTIFKEFPAAPTWPGDQELQLNFAGGCANYLIGVAGAKDAQGKVLDPALNPVLDLHMPCHGDGTVVVNLSGKERPDVPIGSLIMDIDPNSGWVLARNGTIYFLIASDSKTKKQVARVETSAWAGFLPDGRILLGDGNALKVVSQHGEVQRTIALQHKPVNGAIAPDGKSAVVVLEKGVVRLDLTTWEPVTINEIASLDRFARLSWSNDRLLMIPQQDEAYSVLVLPRGEIEFPTGLPQISSPNGQLVVDPVQGGVYDAGGKRIFALTDKLEAGKHPYAIWAPDNRHVFFPGGQVIDVTTGKEIAAFTFEFPACKPVPQKLGKAGADLIAMYVVPCH